MSLIADQIQFIELLHDFMQLLLLIRWIKINQIKLDAFLR